MNPHTYQRIRRTKIRSIKRTRLVFFVTLGIMGIGLTQFSLPMLPSAGQPTGTSTTISATPTPSIAPTQGGAAATDAVTPSGTDVLPPSDHTTPSPIASSDSSPTPTPTPTPTPSPTPTPTPNLLRQDAIPEINTLVEAYYMAKLAGAREDFTGLVTNPELVNIDENQKMLEFVKGYSNFSCYTKRGIGEIDYVVYVRYDMEIVTIETLAPSLDRLLVQLDENGQPLIYLGTKSDAVDTYLAEVAADEDVLALIEDVSKQTIAAVESDEQLADFFRKLQQQ